MDELPGTCGELLELLGAIASASRRQSEAAARLQEPGIRGGDVSEAFTSQKVLHVHGRLTFGLVSGFTLALMASKQNLAPDLSNLELVAQSLSPKC